MGTSPSSISQKRHMADDPHDPGHDRVNEIGPAARLVDMGRLGMAVRQTGRRGPRRLPTRRSPSCTPCTGPGLVRLGALLLRDRDRAEEVVQDAFVAAYPRWPRLREEGTALAYLRRSVVNGCRSGLRHHGVEERYLARGPGRPTPWAGPPARAPRPPSCARRRRRHARARWTDCPSASERSLVLRYYPDLSERQIADALDISPGSVKAHAHRGLTTLRDTLEGAS